MKDRWLRNHAVDVIVVTVTKMMTENTCVSCECWEEHLASLNERKDMVLPLRGQAFQNKTPSFITYSARRLVTPSEMPLRSKSAEEYRINTFFEDSLRVYDNAGR